MFSIRPFPSSRPYSQILRIIILLLVFLAISISQSAAGDPEFQINTTTSGDQVYPSIAVDSHGNFIVAWNGGITMPPPSRTDIFVQRFDSALNFLGPETQINMHSSGSHVYPSVDVTPDGKFLVVWAASDFGVTGIGVFGRHYNEQGNPLGPEFQINSITAEQTPITPAMAMNDSGAFVATWQSSHVFKPGLLYVIFFDSNSNPLGPELTVTPEPQYAGFQPCAEMDNDGNVIIVWRASEETVNAGIYGQRYNKYGYPVGTKFQIDAAGDSAHSGPDVAMDGEGNFVVVWSGQAQGAGHGEIKARMYDSSGNPISPEFQVNTFENGEQMDPAIARNPSGDFVVFWESDTSGTHNWDIFGRRFDSSGCPIMNEFQANSYTDGYQLFPAVALHDSLIFITWTSFDQDGDGMGIFGRGLLGDPATHIANPEYGQLQLSQNYPNPFNPITIIEFYMPESLHAKLSIYDVQGKLITNLIDDVLPKGSNRFNWNGRNKDGEIVSSGIYFYRLSVGGRSIVKKMAFLK